LFIENGRVLTKFIKVVDKMYKQEYGMVDIYGTIAKKIGT